MNEITEKQYQERIIALNHEVTRLTALIGTTSYKSAYEKQKALVTERDNEIYNLRQEVARQITIVHNISKREADLISERTYWWVQPWYKRVWSALTESKYL